MQDYSPPITGTDIWYYFICKRELWLIMHQIVPDQEDENIDIGRFLHEYYSKRGKMEVDIGSGKLDRIKRVGEKLIVQEIKKSSRFRESSYFQLLFYLYELRKIGIEAIGELLFAEEKRKETVILTEDHIQELESAIKDIKRIAKLEFPPKPKKTNFCRKCGYREYCWAGEEE